ncbi:MAG: peptide ligase PGM1-related protein [Acidimicrobiia bacterium]|nr:peptide ligase PGM1-related protein [Acidimicrobiia bacterium]
MTEGSAGLDLWELERFDRLQRSFPAMYRQVFSDPKAPRTVVVVPSMSLDTAELAKIDGVLHYEERMLCLLMLLKLPRTEVVYVTSRSVDPAIVDYYLHLLPGVPAAHARSRLKMVSCEDSSLTPLTQKVLDRRHVIEAIRTAISYPATAHMTCFNSTPLERTLAVRLSLPLYAADPELAVIGTKSVGRRILREAGLSVPDGVEGITDTDGLVDAVVELHSRNPSLETAIVKLNEGFSGEGNALLDLRGLAESPSPRSAARRALFERLTCVAAGEIPERFLAKVEGMGAIVEEKISGKRFRSPSVQMRIDPTGSIAIVSTHDQVLSGLDGHVFEGCTFPARRSYRLDLHDAGRRVGQTLRDAGVIGRFAVDFVTVKEGDTWTHHAIEINLRKGGTTFPYLMLEFLTNGSYDPDTGVFRTPTGDTRSYYATDNLVREAYRNRSATELIDLAVFNGFLYDAPSQQGLVLHLLGAAPEHGKIGIVSIADDRRHALQRYRSATAALTRHAEELMG